MKKALSLILTIIFALGCFAFPCAAQASAGVTVVLPEGASAQERYACDMLCEYLSDILGSDVPAGGVTDGAVNIILSADPALGEGAYTLTERDGNLFITGGGKRGTIYGAFAFLEKLCGCKFYTNEEFLIPSADSIDIPAGYSFEYTPYFEYTETDWKNGGNTVFTVANGINGGTYSNTPENMGGCIRYISGFCHTLTTQFCSANSYFAEHPEYFALHGGERTPNQLCLTNPDTLRIVTDEILSLLASRHDPGEALQIVSVTQHDNGDFCECPSCKALDDENGSHSGTMVTFANSIAEAVENAGYDNVAIDTFAYQYTRQAPSKVVPRDNVIIRLCSIECCFGHTFDNPSCPENAKFMKDLEDWSKICNRIYIWDYGTNYSEYINFFPNFHVLQKNMQIFYEHNVKGVYGEGNYQLDACNGEFCDLRYYIQAKLMQNPYLDYDAEVNGFLDFFYGGGYKEIREFIDICSEKGVTAKKHAGIFDRAKGSLPGLTSADIKKCDSLWQTANELAETPEQKERVHRSEFCWRYWKCANGKDEFSLLHTPYQLMKARDDLYLDLVDAGTTILGETGRKRLLSQCYALHLLRIPFCWTNLYDNGFWDFISPAVVAIYKFLGSVHTAFGI